MSYLDKIETAFTNNRGHALITYGPVGIGKTGMAACMPDPLIIAHRREQGINDLKKAGIVSSDVPVFWFETWNEMVGILGSLEDTEGDRYRSVCIDSLTWVQQVCYDEVCSKHFNNDWTNRGFLDYQAGPRQAETEYWPVFIDALEDLCQSGININLVAHSRTRPQTNPNGVDYESFVPEMDDRSLKLLKVWAEHIIFMNHHISATKESSRAKGKVDHSAGRYMYCDGSPTYLAKSKGLPDEIDMGSSGQGSWHNLEAALNARKPFPSTGGNSNRKIIVTPMAQKSTNKKGIRDPVKKKKIAHKKS